jgi:hypothetical protein
LRSESAPDYCSVFIDVLILVHSFHAARLDMSEEGPMHYDTRDAGDASDHLGDSGGSPTPRHDALSVVSGAVIPARWFFKYSSEVAISRRTSSSASV